MPIDHGAAFPDNLAAQSYELEYLSWQAANEPFSEKNLAYIRGINTLEDIRMLDRFLYFRPICLRNVRISTTLLKMGAEAGLTVAKIGQILCRPDDDDNEPSILEQIVLKARQLADLKSKRLKGVINVRKTSQMIDE